MSISQAQSERAQQDIGQEIERSVRETIESAMRAAEAAQAQAAVAASQAADAQGDAAQSNAPQPPPPPNNEPGGDFSFRVSPDGFVVVQTQPDGTETTTPWDATNIIPPQVTDMMLIGVLGVIGMILAFPIGRAVARWIDRRGAVSNMPNDVSSRLAAIEDSVQAVAIEVERLSETNRYTARLLSERVAAPDFRAGDAREAREATPESVPPRSTWQAS